MIATPVATPANLFGCDINLEMTPLQGGIAFDPTTQTYRITGAGGEAPATMDQVFLASRLVSGDFDITVRVLDRPANQAGLMVREALDGPARMFFLAATSSRGVLSRYRDRRLTSSSAR